jgi:ubiquinone/menaquinone biosynthesis C-methylase UbiE
MEIFMVPASPKNREKTKWGRHLIAGPKHDYRERALMQLITRYAAQGTSVLDIGSGSGSLLFRLARAGYKVKGIEISESFVEHTRNQLSILGFDDRIDIAVGVAEELSLGDRSTDSVVLAEVLEHLPDDRKGLSEAHRVLRDNGLLFITVPANPALWTSVDEEAGHYRRYTSEQLAQILINSGFSILEMRWWGFPVTRIYEKILFRPWSRARSRAGKSPGSGGFMGTLAKHTLVRTPISMIFSIDELFRKLPFGIGLMAVARKRPTDT